MSSIVSFVKAAFDAKLAHGPNSDEFKAAQMRAMSEIDAAYQVGACVTLPSEDDCGINIRIEKKGKGPNMCSYVKVRIKA